MEQVTHDFAPVFDEYATILILGTIPSPKSREQGFYYGHPRNRFWHVVADVFGETIPVTIEEKKEFALRNHIAIWDVLASCTIHGADDSSIKEPVINDLRVIFDHADIRRVFTTGNKATVLYRNYCEPKGYLPCVGLPSTSPANCRMRYEELLEYYKVLYRSIDDCTK